MREEAAREVAGEALVWLANNEDLLLVFMKSSGNTVDSVRKGAESDDFLASVLDFLLMEDEWIVAFCEAGGRKYAEPAAARVALPGGADVHWT